MLPASLQTLRAEEPSGAIRGRKPSVSARGTAKVLHILPPS